jgi:transcription-repair coupling factor (superfamily II helicase)
VPEARIGVAHGQLRERELEQVMRDFLQQRFNVLLCSTIIETGIDIPNANTILINRADKFGLAQLHQLRGRVGRSHHQAYAYLLTPDGMTKDAGKRLEAIQLSGELGAGFYLAMHDMEIRGAGEVLGEGQSGEMQEVGFSLFTEMLKQAVRDLKKAASRTWTHRWASPPKSICTARRCCRMPTARTCMNGWCCTSAWPPAIPSRKSTPSTKS